MKKATTSKKLTRRKTGKKIKQQFPPGWNERRVRAVIRHYEELTDQELGREIENAPQVRDETLISIPTPLGPVVRKLIVRHQRSA